MPSVLDALKRSAAADLARLAEATAEGVVSPDILFNEAARILKRTHIEAALAGRQAAVQGPIQGALSRIMNIIAPLRGGLEEKLRSELGFMSSFISEITAGNLSEAQIAARFDMYGDGISKTYWGAQTAVQSASGFTEERRILNGDNHCDDCIGYASQGWQPIGTLPEPGDECQCISNCNCGKEYQ
jgi:hypothetical protein